jgi:hypothetical protein
LPKVVGDFLSLIKFPIMQTIPTNNITYTEFFNQVRASIANGTFAKLTLAKTVGKARITEHLRKNHRRRQHLKIVDDV